jgi:hypothetical protein
VPKPLWLTLGACTIQAEYGYSAEETALQIQVGAYLQFHVFYGMYNIYVNGKWNKQIHLSKDGLDKFIIEA